MQLRYRGQAVAACGGEEIEDLRNLAGTADIDEGLLRGAQRQRIRATTQFEAMCCKTHVLQLRGHLLIDLPQLAVLPSERDDQHGQQQGDNGEQDALEHRSSLNTALGRTYPNWRAGC
ncbi:hypothetical protein VM57_06735 [Stenotrophomonas maltophilia]|uniref:Uncharacterized protein n=1 Tax=Stenotrophomonas maltophilia TaxID=40324 RepID=A0A0F5ZNX9_STEMA|nr:hypothetical protein VM57_06735 [Stenotrophomonas maltophilia]